MRVVAGTLLFAILLVLLPGCRKAPPPVNEVVAIPSEQVPLDPRDRVWNRAPEHVARLLLQDLVEPRLMEPSTAHVRVRAVTNGVDIAFHLQWEDLTRDDHPGAGNFVDACAIQIPRKIEPEAPDPQMGQAGRTVDISYWRADWQASVDGRGDTIQDLYPHASVDHYPFEAPPLEPGTEAQRDMAKRYSPAWALGNRRAGPREYPVEDMVAEGPGTISPNSAGSSRGQGIRTRDGWMVVFVRPLPEGLTARTRTQIAFAVWEGSRDEVGARKMRTGWIPLSLREGQ